MKYSVVSFALCVGLLTTSLSTFAQISNQSANSQSKPRRKTKVDVKYDKKKNLTGVMLEEIVLWTNPAYFEQVTMDVSFAYPTRRIVTPKSVSIAFRSVTKGGTAFMDENLAATIDGTQLDLGTMDRAGNRDLGPKPGIYFDGLRKSISYADFVRIAQAKKLSLMVGGRHYDVSNEQIRLLSDFLQLMQQEGEEFR